MSTGRLFGAIAGLFRRRKRKYLFHWLTAEPFKCIPTVGSTAFAVARIDFRTIQEVEKRLQEGLGSRVSITGVTPMDEYEESKP